MINVVRALSSCHLVSFRDLMKINFQTLQNKNIYFKSVYFKSNNLSFNTDPGNLTI